ncbi:ABC transporter ATP-binding protein [Luteibacter sp. Lutesp34]|uniref:ABC transporter ATP-binding protein n=1 Tax=Luteibacter sp. Lutesp34 TaxID=3243030 RepID=UPI0039B46534
MCSDKAILVAGVAKAFPIYEKPHHRLMQMLSPKGNKRRWFREFHALRGVSFDVGRGETVGIIGRNGSGKSTLLQIICGTLSPSSGMVEVNGRIAALLELGAGFNPEFTGRENVYLNGSLLGLSRDEIDARYEDILAFAGIGDFIDQPVKTYSSGMYVRLAFAVASNVKPDILIVDEALAVGDAKFQAKCFARLKNLRDAGTTILFVSHSTEQIVTHCDRAVLLDGGVVVADGSPKVVVNQYLDLLFGVDNPSLKGDALSMNDSDGHVGQDLLDDSDPSHSDPFSTRPNYNSHEYRWGDRRALLRDFSLQAGGVQNPTSVPTGEPIRLALAIQFVRTVHRPILGIAVKNKEGVTVYATNSEMLEVTEFPLLGEAGTTARVDLDFTCSMGAGDYFISLGVASRDGSEVTPHDRRYDAIHLHVLGSSFVGFSNLELQMRMPAN